jgi:hypothetical protein
MYIFKIFLESLEISEKILFISLSSKATGFDYQHWKKKNDSDIFSSFFNITEAITVVLQRG